MRKIYILTVMAVIALGLFINTRANAQAVLKTMYFAENSTLRHRLNPAFAPLQGYVGMPFLSSIKLDLEGNIGAKHVLYPLDNGKLGTLMHPDVSADALNKFPDMAHLNFHLDYDIFNIGWRRGETGFWTLDWTQRIDVYTTIPKQMLTFLKVGMKNDPTVYSFENLGVAQAAYNQIALGFSSDIKPVKGLRVGGKLKFLVGIDDAKVRVDRMTVSMSKDEWKINAKASGYAALGGLQLGTDENGSVNSASFDASRIAPSGYGFAADFGISYVISEDTPVDGLGFSFAVTDLGAIINMQSTLQKVESPDGEFVYTGFEDVDFSQSGSLNEQVNNIKDSFMSMLKLTPQEVGGNMTRMLNTKLYAGIDYSFLKERRMNVGLLYTCEFSPLKTLHEMTFSWNYMPVDWFDVSLSYSFLNVYESFGVLLNFTPRRGVNFFIGTDYVNFRYAVPYPVPVDHAYLNLQMGISFPIGEKMIRLAER